MLLAGQALVYDGAETERALNIAGQGPLDEASAIIPPAHAARIPISALIL